MKWVRMAPWSRLVWPVGLALGVFAADLWISGDFGESAAYVAVVLLAHRMHWPTNLNWVAAGCSVLILVGNGFLSDSASVGSTVSSRLIAIALLWLTAWVVPFGRLRGPAWSNAEKIDSRAAELLGTPERDRFRQLIESAPISFVMVDLEAKIVFVNEQAEAMFGRGRDELVGQHYRILVPERFHEDHRRLQAEYLKAPQARTLGTGEELYAIRKDGSEFPVEVGLTPLVTESGFVVLGAIVDISARKQAEAALRESERRLSRVLEAAGAGIWEWNVATGELWLSDDWLHSLGYTRADVVVPHVDFGASLVHPEDLPRVNAALEAHFQKRAPNYHCEFRLRAKDGQYRWTQGTGKVVEWDSNGKPLRLVGSDTDITERRHAEARFRATVESAPTAMVMIDRNGTLVLANAEVERQFGYSRSELLGQPVEMLVPQRYREHHPTLRAGYFEHPEARRMGGGRELFGLRKDGSEFPVEIGLSPLETDEGLFVLSVIMDITERKRSEARLQELNRTLERRVDDRTRLVSLLKDVAATCNQAESVEEACSAVLERVCRYLGWSQARAHVIEKDLLGPFPRSDLWFPAPPRTTVSDVVLAGTGSIAAANTRSEWLTDVAQLADSVRREEYAQLGIRSVFSMPVMMTDVVFAVLEFFHSEPTPPNEELLAVADELGRLLGRVVERSQLQHAVEESVEAEQRRIGQELHDGIGQEMTALSLLSRSIALTLKSEGSSAADKADEFASSIPRLVRQIRNVIRGLMPVELDANGLMSALQQLADSTQQRHGIRCHLDLRHAVPVANPTVAHHLFRIAQEAINNALKHGQPKSILMTLQANNSTLDLTVRDDGTGILFDPMRSHDGRPRGMGLRIMRHRARLIGGQFSIQSPPGGGTIVSCRLQRQEVSHDEH